MHHLVHYVATAPHQMRGLPVFVIVQDGAIQVMIDRTKIDGRIFGILEMLANQVAATLTPRDTPAPTPWGRTRLPLIEASSPGVMIPTVTPSGIICPLPQQLVAADLAHALELLTNDTLRLYHPPAQ